MLLINCKNGVTINNVKQCYVNVNMKADKTIVPFYFYLLKNNPFYSYTLKGEENKYLFSDILYRINLNIELLSGNISIETSLNTDEYYENKNKKLFIFSRRKKFYLTIKALENSFFLISDNYFSFNEGTFVQPGGN